MSDQPWPALRPQLVSVAGLKKYANNANTHSDEQIESLMRSIERWGFTQPILVDETGTVIAGHARLEAATRLKLEQVPVVRAVNWTEDQKRAFCIADNRMAQLAEWDDDKLRHEIQALVDHEVIADIGFERGEIDDLLRIANDEGKAAFRPKEAKTPGKAAAVESSVIEKERLARIGREALPITESEESVISALLHYYVKHKSIKNGFFAWLLRSKNRAA